jgi:glycosyltransferase involved in cell wall biosynthesis
MTPARVLHLLGSARRGVAQTRIVSGLAGELGHRAWALNAWFLEEAGPLVEMLSSTGVDARFIGVGGALDVGGQIRFQRALRDLRPAIVHLHVGGRTRMWAPRLLGARCIAHVHAEVDNDETRLDIDRFVRAADAIIATSQAVAVSTGGGATVVYPGVALGEKSGGHEGRATIGTVARLEPVKGLDILVAAFARILDAGCDAELEIAGAGSSEPTLRALVEGRGLVDRVKFLGWRSNVTALHARWDLFAAPSRSEGFGYAVLEAMAAGLPVLASRVGGLTELVADGVTGVLVEPGHPGALARALEALLGDPATRSSMGAAGRERVAREFTVRRMAEGIEGVYARLLGL